jgi:hypothetical protein
LNRRAEEHGQEKQTNTKNLLGKQKESATENDHGFTWTNVVCQKS